MSQKLAEYAVSRDLGSDPHPANRRKRRTYIERDGNGLFATQTTGGGRSHWRTSLVRNSLIYRENTGNMRDFGSSFSQSDAFSLSNYTFLRQIP